MDARNFYRDLMQGREDSYESESDREWDIPLALDNRRYRKRYVPLYDDWIGEILEVEMEDQVGISPELSEALDEVKDFMRVRLNRDNFKQYLTFLLYAEEYVEQTLFEKTRFDEAKLIVKKVTQSNGEKKMRVIFEVEGLSQTVLSIIPGLDLSFYSFDTTYKDVIEEIDHDTLYLEDRSKDLEDKFALKENICGGVPCEDVRFFPSKISYRRMHRAIYNIDEPTIERLLPKIATDDDIPARIPIELECTKYFNSSIGTNEMQSQAIHHILNGTSYPYPYILFGPPGTGKTQTLTEAILQVWSQDESSRIVFAAPSNAAADVLALQLLEFLPKTSFVRLMSKSKEPQPTLYKEGIVRYCSLLKEDDPRYPYRISFEELSSFRIVVTTLKLSAVLVNEEVDEFSHVFIDEASQATIPEILLPIVDVLSDDGHIILAGDPHQLSPVVDSPVADNYGMKTSLLERLMNSCPLYQENEDDKRNPQFITMLLKNFRSHPDLIKLPSKLYYKNKLIPAVDMAKVSQLCTTLPFIPNKKFPILFHAIISPHFKSQDTKVKSLFNKEELECVFHYIKLLNEESVPNSSIGILSPYKLQVNKIKDELKRNNMKDILVGSTEQFQGGERDVMIISTVRSSLVSNEMGFLNNPKRFNVAITRAKSLMIVIGDPDLLIRGGRTWKKLLTYVVQNRNCIGSSGLNT